MVHPCLLVQLLGHGLPLRALEQGDVGDGTSILHRRHDADGAEPRVLLHGCGGGRIERPLGLRHRLALRLRVFEVIGLGDRVRLWGPSPSCDRRSLRRSCHLSSCRPRGAACPLRPRTSPRLGLPSFTLAVTPCWSEIFASLSALASSARSLSSCGCAETSVDRKNHATRNGSAIVVFVLIARSALFVEGGATSSVSTPCRALRTAPCPARAAHDRPRCSPRRR